MREATRVGRGLGGEGEAQQSHALIFRGGNMYLQFHWGKEGLKE